MTVSFVEVQVSNVHIWHEAICAWNKQDFLRSVESCPDVFGYRLCLDFGFFEEKIKIIGIKFVFIYFTN